MLGFLGKALMHLLGRTLCAHCIFVYIFKAFVVLKWFRVLRPKVTLLRGTEFI